MKRTTIKGRKLTLQTGRWLQRGWSQRACRQGEVLGWFQQNYPLQIESHQQNTTFVSDLYELCCFYFLIPKRSIISNGLIHSNGSVIDSIRQLGYVRINNSSTPPYCTVLRCWQPGWDWPNGRYALRITPFTFWWPWSTHHSRGKSLVHSSRFPGEQHGTGLRGEEGRQCIWLGNHHAPPQRVLCSQQGGIVFQEEYPSRMSPSSESSTIAWNGNNTWIGDPCCREVIQKTFQENCIPRSRKLDDHTKPKLAQL